MLHALPNPQAIVILLVTLVLGIAGGATVAAILADDDIVINRPAAGVATQSQAPSSARPEEGAAARAMNVPAAPVTSEKSTDPSVNGGTKVSGLSEKSSDPSLSDPSYSLSPKGSKAQSNGKFGTRP